MEMKKQLLFTICSAFMAQGCSNLGYGAMRGSEHGLFALQGDARGIESWSTSIHGIIEASKNPLGASPSTHRVMRHRQTMRALTKSSSPLEDFLNLGKDSKELGTYTDSEKKQVDDLINGGLD